MKLSVLVRESDGTMNQRELSVPEAGCLIGRSGPWKEVGEDPYCSRRHALLYFDRAGDLHIRDLNSRNGTFVQGARVVDETLVGNVEFRVGRTTICVLSAFATERRIPEDLIERAEYDRD